eukprot:TRINITY_DN40911_c0_g2_i1.p1 TRINITY_DN40911_c0_g2~~TRINITY_DN40911_c0_g2_i1.p1  ORF type:complete len:534 (-),score=77.04 TRINITY_DN40911_c0_g2_i1:199-1779(-)
MPSLQCCGGLVPWLKAAQPTLILASGSAKSGGFLHGVDNGAVLTHSLCQVDPLGEEDGIVRVQRVQGSGIPPVGSGAGLAQALILHAHGATVRRVCDESSRFCWHRVELLHFVLASDGCVRVGSYGGTNARERNYYAHALTDPDGHLARWGCSIASANSTSFWHPAEPVKATVVSSFGYDSVLYCDVPVDNSISAVDGQAGELLLRLRDVGHHGARELSPIRLCPVLPLTPLPFRLAVCTQPLHGYEALNAAAPGVLAEFIEYHRLLGADHFTIFDADGSFEAPLRAYAAEGLVEYIGRWPERFAGPESDIARASNSRPIMLEAEAENACMWGYRGRAAWVALLHSPDEFLHVPLPTSGHDGAGARSEAAADGALLRFLDHLEPHRPRLSHVTVQQVLFGGQDGGAAIDGTLIGRYVHRASATETAAMVPHTFIANPLNVAQAGVHPARPRPLPEGEDPFLVVRADPFRDLRVNHYVDALAGRTRCGPSLCNVLDEEALGAAEELRRRLQLRRERLELAGVGDVTL